MEEELSKLSTLEPLLPKIFVDSSNPAVKFIKLIASNADIGIIIYSPELRVIFVNEFYTHFSENLYKIAPQLNMSVNNLFPEEIRLELVEKLNQTLKGIRVDFVTSYQINGEMYFYRRVATPIFNENKIVLGILGLVYDLSDLYHNKEELEKVNFELDKRIQERTEQLEKEIQTRKAIETELRIAKEQISLTLHKEKELSTLKGKLLNNISHEINTPLTIISSSSFLIENYLNYHQYDEIYKYLSQINNAVKSLNETIEQASTASNILLGDFPSQSSIRNIVDFCDQFIDRIQDMSNEKQQFVKDFSSRIIILETNYDILEQILMQFISNAIKFTQENCQITLKISEEDDSVIISVIDNGIGIPKNEQEHLFDLFYRADSVIGKYSGSGLGLSIAKHLADKINAHIEFTTQEGIGSEFSLIIPKV